MDRVFLSALSPGTSILLIPYACSDDEYEDIFERVEDCFSEGGNLEIILKEKVSDIRPDVIEECQGMLIEGGNTFDLITVCREGLFPSLLKEFSLKPENIIYADSAGAIILGASVKTAFFGEDSDVDQRRLQNYRGFNLLGGWTVHCHYTPADDDEVMELIYDLGTPVLALAEETGILIDDKKHVTVYGKVPLVIFTMGGKNKVYPGQVIDLGQFF